VAAERGHEVTLFEADSEIGGQFNIAKRIPGKEEFYETLRYYRKHIERTGVTLKCGVVASVALLSNGNYDEIVIATGVVPREPALIGLDHPKVLGYLEVLRSEKPVGETVAIVGAGGIGFDVAEFLLQEGESASQNPTKFYAEWGIDPSYRDRGAIRPPTMEPPRRKVWLLKRKATKDGEGLGKTTGWIHRTSLKQRGVEMVAGVTYRRVDDEGLHVTIGGKDELLRVDSVVICAGQEPRRELHQELLLAGITARLIGGADKAVELDAKRAIDQGARLAADI
jgi:2,4-dienoyl-CoA reductase (NADPH2)